VLASKIWLTIQELVALRPLPGLAAELEGAFAEARSLRKDHGYDPTMTSVFFVLFPSLTQ
jgi:hypothetical protein